MLHRSTMRQITPQNIAPYVLGCVLHHVRRSAMDARTGTYYLGRHTKRPVGLGFTRSRAAVAIPGIHRHACQPDKVGEGYVHLQVWRQIFVEFAQIVRTVGCLPVSINAAFKAFSAACCELYARLRLSCRSADEDCPAERKSSSAFRINTPARVVSTIQLNPLPQYGVLDCSEHASILFQ